MNESVVLSVRSGSGVGVPGVRLGREARQEVASEPVGDVQAESFSEGNLLQEKKNTSLLSKLLMIAFRKIILAKAGFELGSLGQELKVLPVDSSFNIAVEKCALG